MPEKNSPFATVEEAVEEIRQGRMIVLVDDEDRENEGDLTMAAEKITPDAINFMAKYGRGLICMPLTEDRCDELRLPLMSPINTSVHGTAFTEAIDARVGVSTGISASDRAVTILTAIDPKTRPQDLARPGHVFPLRARTGEFKMIAYSSDVDHDQHIALVRGNLEGQPPALVRVHSHCLTGDVFSSTTCDCRELIAISLEAIARENRGVFLYLHHTGRGFSVDPAEEPGALPQIHFHKRGQLDREPARQRMVQHESGIGAQILIDLGLRDIRVLTNHPKKVVALEGYGIRIADQVPLRIEEPKPTHQTL